MLTSKQEASFKLLITDLETLQEQNNRELNMRYFADHFILLRPPATEPSKPLIEY